MAVIKTYDELLARIGNGYARQLPLATRMTLTAQAGTFAPNEGTGAMPLQRIWARYTIPSLESGVTAYIPIKALLFGGAQSLFVICGRITNLGSLNIGTNTFTSGSAMPSVTELNNASQARCSPVICEITTARDANAASITVTYVDQDGNGSETTTGAAITNSAAVGQSCWLNLNSPDWGVRSISTAARSSGTGTGVIKFWGMEPIFCQPVGPAALSGTSEMQDFIMQSLNLFPLGAGDVIGMWGLKGSASVSGDSGNIQGNLTFLGDS